MHALHVHAGNIFGGVERILVTLAARRALCPGLEPAFALCFGGRLNEELRATGVRLHDLGPVQIRRFWTVWKARRLLRSLLSRHPCDVVLCHSAWSQAIFGPVARRCGKRLVYWLHNRTQGRQRIERWARRVAPDLVLCVSPSTAETAGCLYPQARRAVFYSPLALAEADFQRVDRAAVRAEVDTPVQAVVIIQVSRMESWKGHRAHLQALAQLKDLPDWICWQVGGPERPEEEHYFDELKRLAESQGLQPRIRFLGRRRDVPRLLMSADLFCQPNRDTEGFSIAFMEAFFARLPIVTTAIGGALDLVNDSCGVLLPPDDLPALVEALRRLIQDAQLRRTMGSAGRERVLELSDPARQMQTLGVLLRGVLTSTKAVEKE